MPGYSRKPTPEPIAAPVVPTCAHDGGELLPWKAGAKCAVCGCGFVRGAWVGQGADCPRFSSQFRSEIPPPEAVIE